MDEYEVYERIGRLVQEIETKRTPYIFATFNIGPATMEAKAGQPVCEKTSGLRRFVRSTYR